MASIRKRGNSYLIVVSMGYDCAGNRLKSMQQTVHPPAGMTPKQTEKWLNEQAVLFELSCKQQQTASNMTLAEYSKYWFENIAPNKLASSTVAREKSDIDHRSLQAHGAAAGALSQALRRTAQRKEYDKRQTALRADR